MRLSGKGKDEEEILGFEDREEIVKQASREQKRETSQGHYGCQETFKTLLRCIITVLK